MCPKPCIQAPRALMFVLLFLFDWVFLLPFFVLCEAKNGETEQTELKASLGSFHSADRSLLKQPCPCMFRLIPILGLLSGSSPSSMGLLLLLILWVSLNAPDLTPMSIKILSQTHSSPRSTHNVAPPLLPFTDHGSLLVSKIITFLCYL